MEIVVICALLGLIPALIARSKGRSMFGWWIYGALLFIVALIHVLFVSDLKQERAKKAAAAKRRQEQQAREAEQAELRDCPYCAEPIKKKAIKCKHCGSDVEPEAGSSDVRSMTTQELEAEAARQALTEISQQSKPKVSTKHAMVLLTVGGTLVALMIYGAMGQG